MDTQKHYYIINYYHHFSDADKKHYNKIKYDAKTELIEETIEYFEVKLMNYLDWDVDVIQLTKMTDDIEEIKVTDDMKNRDEVINCIDTLNKYCAWLEELNYG